MTISQLAYKQKFIQNNLREKATEIVQLSGREAARTSLKATKDIAFAYLEESQDTYTGNNRSVKSSSTAVA
ncbi:hypothetical protein [Planococcus dechangensis]|uniref:DUF3813 domain-containing protein n=1 Tax=Planococcus dechangensis TaxID=1176255 RepID=A0ABV9MFG8_9BACL